MESPSASKLKTTFGAVLEVPRYARRTLASKGISDRLDSQNQLTWFRRKEKWE